MSAYARGFDVTRTYEPVDSAEHVAVTVAAEGQLSAMCLATSLTKRADNGSIVRTVTVKKGARVKVTLTTGARSRRCGVTPRCYQSKACPLYSRRCLGIMWHLWIRCLLVLKLSTQR